MVKLARAAVALVATIGLVGIAVPGAAAATPVQAAAAAAPGCVLRPTNGLITVGLGSRQYQLYVPPGLTSASVPLLISLHGAGSNGTEDALSTDWDSFAAANGFVVAYPDAGFPDEPSVPYLGGGAWDPYTQSSTDEGFILSVVSSVEGTYCIDPTHVYLDGWSNGAVMSQRMACAAADVFAAADSYAGGDPTVWQQTGASAGPYTGAPCMPSRPIPVSLIVGQEDFTYAGLSENSALWERVDGCSSPPVTETDQYGSSETYGCADGSQLYTRVVNDTSHNWPIGAQGEDQRERIWSFFMAHPLP